VSGDHKRTIKNPAGYLITFLEGDQSIPKSYKTKRERQAEEETRLKQEAARSAECSRSLADMQIREEYERWRSAQADAFIASRFSGEELSERLGEISNQLRKDKTMASMFEHMRADVRRDQLIRILKKELVGELCLPSIEDWQSSQSQSDLF